GALGTLAVRQVSHGRLAPTLFGRKSADRDVLDLAVRWKPALVDEAAVEQLVAHLPGPVTLLAPGPGRATALNVPAAMVDARRRRRGVQAPRPLGAAHPERRPAPAHRPARPARRRRRLVPVGPDRPGRRAGPRAPGPARPQGVQAGQRRAAAAGAARRPAAAG